MAYADIVAGNFAIASQMRGALNDKIYRVAKTSDQAVSSATTGSTLVDDAELLVPLNVPNVRYAFQALIRCASPTAADIKFTFSGPSGSTIVFGGPPPDVSTTTAVNFAEAIAPGVLVCGGTGGIVLVSLHGSLTTGSTLGNVRLRWAQNTANAGATTVYNFSWLEVGLI